MRLLVIRGRNLASLAEPFEVDLTAEPLRSAGLFAITGETGAGKSTLLDALCLALYGGTPRMQAEGGREDVPDPSGEAIKSFDPRTLLRRGASEGLAEVEFIGHDGARYRATWTVRRARAKASGRLQKVERALFRLPADGAPEPVADRSESVKAEVEALTDLTFEQFRRTALLAQGEFDAFIRAGDSDKAELLEKITGSEIFGKISQAAFRQANEAKAIVLAIEARLGGVTPLEGEARAAHEARLDGARLELGEAVAQLAVLSAEQGQRARLDDAEARQGRAVALLAQAETAHDAAAPLRERKARLDAVAPLRARMEDLAQARAALMQASEAVDVETAALERSTKAADDTAQRVNDLSQTHDLVAETIRQFEPDWQRATALDAQLAAAGSEAAKATAEKVRASEALEAANAALAARVREQDALSLQAAGLDQRAAASARLAPFAGAWPALRRRLAERIETVAAHDRAGRERTDAAALINTATDRLAAFAARLAAEEKAQVAAQTQAQERAAALAALDPAGLQAETSRLASLAEAWREAGRAALAQRSAAERLHEARINAEAAKDRLAVSTARQGAAETALLAMRQRRADQQAGVDLADAIEAQAAATLRGALVTGEPCPVCGSREHPALAHPDAISAHAARLKADRLALDAEIEREQALLIEARTTIGGASAALTQAEQAIARHAAELASEAAIYTALAGRIDPLPPLDQALATLAATTATIATQQQALQDKLGRAAVLAEERETLRRKADAAGEGLATLRSEIDETQRLLAEARTSEATAAERQGQALAQSAAQTAELLPLLTASDLAVADLDRDAPGVLQRLEARFAELAALERERLALSEAQTALAATLLSAQGAVFAAQDRASETTETARHRDESVASLLADRAALLGGEATASHRERHRVTLEQSLRARETAERASVDAKVGLAAARVRCDNAVANRANASARVGEREAALLAARTQIGLAMDEVDALLLTPVEAIDALTMSLEAIAADLTRATTVLAEASAAMAALAPARETTRAAEAIGADIIAATARRSDLDQEIGALTLALRNDDEALAKTADIRAELATAKATAAILMAVSDAVGSEDGSKFRRFAQSLTLERLVSLANHHLATLSPRYRLQRANPGMLGLHIVDRDMGDAIRSTRSLSGGERFLASLALALALSSLEGRRSFVDTLFIDEGFGALDSATLDVAIDALEALQGQGRRVGVISHVAAMIERIAVQVRVEKAGAGRSVVRIGLAASA